MKMKALNHLNLVVEDVERSAGFYESVFGMERQHKQGEFIFLLCGDTDLALVQGRPVLHKRFHFGFRVDSRAEVDSWLEVAQKRNVEIARPLSDYGDYYTFSCRDPDGYSVEIYYEEGQRGRAGDIG